MPKKLEKFLIKFDNPKAIFFAGQPVSGKVVVVLTERMKMRNIRLYLSGQAVTVWSEPMMRRTMTYYDREQYIDEVVTLWGSLDDKGDSQFLEAGTHRFPFYFTLSDKCPSSFETMSGYIRYVARAVISKPWKFDHATKRAWSVLSLVDLNLQPNAQKKITETKSKLFSSIFHKSGNITCNVRIPRSGFVPGELIPFELEVVNNSGSKVNEVKVFIDEHTELYAIGNGIEADRSVVQAKKGPLEGGQTLSWKNEGIRLPPIAPTLDNCRILKIHYFFNVKVHDLAIKIPIIIGNIPLRDVMHEMNEIYKKNQPSAPSVPLPIGGAYPDLPPPTYEQAIYGYTDIKEEGDNEHTMGQLSFKPAYAYYDWS